ncbi:unnamed protein product [Ostreobium quekettii]|uniref:Uncharacterized protein n=1 Tax=Ostreobium quekettii TaxID=121088 RepID=A0A8S1IRS8_9CHLO|nr:unnamed protein product [Ostreobium quekettii]
MVPFPKYTISCSETIMIAKLGGFENADLLAIAGLIVTTLVLYPCYRHSPVICHICAILCHQDVCELTGAAVIHLVVRHLVQGDAVVMAFYGAACSPWLMKALFKPSEPEWHLVGVVFSMAMKQLRGLQVISLYLVVFGLHKTILISAVDV